MFRRRLVGCCVITLLAAEMAGAQDPAGTWKQISDPAFDASKFAAVEGIELIGDAIHIKLIDGVIQFAEPA